MTTPDKDGEYLTDGIYVTFDGYQIWLHTERDINVWHTIALEPETFDLLLEYRAKVYASPKVNSPEFLRAQRELRDRLFGDANDSGWTGAEERLPDVEEAPAFSFVGTTLHHHPSGKEWTFTDEEIADVRQYIAAHTGSTLDTGVLFEDAVRRFGSTE